MQANIRKTKSSDYPAINTLGTANYPKNYDETDESFNSKMAGYPEGCFVADLDGIIGYVVSFPYLLGKQYPANEPYAPVASPDCYYIHDLTVSPDFRRKGIATQLAKKVLQAHWEVTGLVAVGGSRGFWQTLGFRGFAHIDYYGLKAEYMLLIRD